MMDLQASSSHLLINGADLHQLSLNNQVRQAAQALQVREEAEIIPTMAVVPEDRTEIFLRSLQVGSIKFPILTLPTTTIT